MGKQVCGVKLMSPGGREVAPSGDEKEDAGPGLLTTVCSSINKTHYTAVLDLMDESGNMLDYNSFTLKHGFACHPKQFFTVINAMKILIRV